ncbi:MAG: 3-keto-5-aminohexanoate cleavage protein [Alphaproteobacteria bacterium]
MSLEAGSGWAEPAIISVAPNGARRTKADHPNLPMTTAEVAAAARGAMEAGAAMIHFHTRDKEGRHLLDAEASRAGIDAIRAACGDGLIVQATTEQAGRYQRDVQIAFARALKPEAITVAPREFAPDAASEAETATLLEWLHRERTMIQYILYDANDLARLLDLRKRGLIPGERPSVLYVLGRYSSDGQSKPADILPFLSDEGLGLVWSVCAFGLREGACALAAFSLGGHARVGFENNYHLHDGSLAADNAALVAQAAADARRIGRTVADAAAARELFLG